MMELHCYCRVLEIEPGMLRCNTCNRFFHFGCLKSGRPSNLVRDVFFNFICENCSTTGQEECSRMKMQWIHILGLTLYNLQLQGGGKCGFFRWREHICNFIDRHWNTLFGNIRKKTSTWHGTVAGALSAGCPQYFRSGTAELGESGWWALKDNKPPTLEDIDNHPSAKPVRKCKSASSEQMSPKVEGLRHRQNKNAIQAAMELKERRSIVQEAKDIRKAKMALCQKTMKSYEDPGTSGFKDDDLTVSEEDFDSPAVKPVEGSSLLCATLNINIKAETQDSDELIIPDDNTTPLSSVLVETSTVPALTSAICTVKDSEEDTDNSLQGLNDEEKLDDLDIDPNTMSPAMQPSSPAMEDLFISMDSSPDGLLEVSQECSMTGGFIKEEPVSSEDENASNERDVTSLIHANEELTDSDESSKSEEPSQEKVVSGSGRKRKATLKAKHETQTFEDYKPRYVIMSAYEEQQLLKGLENLSKAVEFSPEAKRLRRKLIVRQLKRERNLPVFDLESEVLALHGVDCNKHGKQEKPVLPELHHFCNHQGSRLLDRFQLELGTARALSHHYTSFVTRLMGLEEDQLESVVSTYTSRTLKPFIFRDYEVAPPKLQLLLELIAYPHRHDTNWSPPPRYPVDYCYVKPQHIPVVNSMCQEFFWPGIDLSECLQYPDFSCIVLYRKVVIGFAFMVPDVKYNEAYIPFIFTHPEWRRAGIATFMLYHLIQTCMGKDVTLHVSATNPSLLLYQKFGFKVEEFILDFYDKYLPVGSTECRHAMFLRLSR